MDKTASCMYTKQGTLSSAATWIGKDRTDTIIERQKMKFAATSLFSLRNKNTLPSSALCRPGTMHNQDMDRKAKCQ